MNRLTCLYVVLGKHMVLSNKKVLNPYYNFYPKELKGHKL